MSSIHRSAADGFAAEAASYVRGRPDYPAEVADWLAGDLGLGKGKTALDLGAGTGKFTTYLVRTGAAVVAVEPVAAMLDQLVERNPGVEAKAGTATAIPLADGSVDAVLCAQSFHWFANGDALDEMRRVLKPGGMLGLIWNVRDERVGWVAELTGIMAPYENGTPRFYSGEWRRLFPADGFGPLQERHFHHGHTGPAEQVIVDRTLSVSFIAALPPEEKARVGDRLRSLIAGTQELAGKDEVTFPYETAAYFCRKLG
ncbi:class I SAM-dependent methyltransferase [Azospirillum picis]|uniref:SAM-dependent methyltransferase n=1 Tax=Azospirillum picis TaxID=488438 RepID=A0ABU0MNZ0_9PROT|nr:class I SAM-dependent methyltransferase [Azospirillum picis]MBP2301362.1 SAM-dependent methyltransferase [Azospirillum picis]MDQ0535193.1 SAM-dependent methyltransferase [Azospirillum picis]